MRVVVSRVAAVIACAACTWACQDDSVVRETGAHAPPATRTARVLALGDSYTSGESVARDESWPYQLVQALVADKVRVDPINVVARTGWTTTDLLAATSSIDSSLDYHVVTLQIGVNNQFAHLPMDLFERELNRLLERAVRLAGGKRSHVVVLSIPDYTVTPFWRRIDPERTAVTELEEYNAVAREIALSHGVAWIDITDISRRALDEPDLITRDGLHPSPRMYAEWVARVHPITRDILVPRPGIRRSP
jgi:lysophospholipase L1-like esterase